MPGKKNMQLVVYGPKKVPQQVKTYVHAQLTRNIELRKLDTSGGFPLTAPTAILTDTTRVPVANRDGLVVNFTKYRMAFSIITDPNAASTTRVRILLVEWFPTSIPTAAQILESVTQPNVIQSAYNFGNRQFYRVIKDTVYALAPYAGKTSVHESWDTKYSKKVRYDDTAGAPISMGLRYWIACTDNVGAVFPHVAYYARAEFTDA